MPDDKESGKRVHPRSPLTLLVQYRFESIDEFVSEYAEDVSLGGMFIRTDEPPEEGSVIFLQFTLRDGSKLVEGLAKVCWCLPPNKASKLGRVPGMGVQFLHFDEESQTAVKDIVAVIAEQEKAEAGED